MDELDESQSASRLKPSKIPSWITLGFILGVLFVWALPRPKEPAASPSTPVESKPEPVPTHPRFSDVEAVFTEWERYAVWADNTTYVCMYDFESKTYPDCFEVSRRGDALYFRSVTRPYNLRARTDVPANSPLEFLNPVPEARGIFDSRPPSPGSPVMDKPRVIPPPPAQTEYLPVEINPPKP